MKPHLTIDSTAWQREVNNLVAITNKGARTIIHDEVKLLLRQGMRITPPRTQAQGRKAVARDVMRAVQPLALAGSTGIVIQNESMRKMVRQKDRVALEAVFAQSKKLRGHRIIEGSEIKSHHRAQRRSRGRVGRAQKVVTLDAKAHRTHTRTMQNRVGRMKAGWVPALNALGESRVAPAWVRRHTSGARGRAVNMLHIKGNPSFLLENSAAGIGHIGPRFQQALNMRARSIRKKVMLLATGQGRKY